MKLVGALIAAFFGLSLCAETISGGITYNIPGNVEPNMSFTVNGHYKDAFVYAGYNPGAGTELIGQQVGKFRTIEAGIGYKYQLIKKISLIASIGYSWVSVIDDNPVQRHEAVVDILRRDHVVQPYMSFYNPETGLADFTDSKYSVSGGTTLRLGLIHKGRWLNTSITYRRLTLRQGKQAWKSLDGSYPDTPSECNCLWWQWDNKPYNALEARIEKPF